MPRSDVPILHGLAELRRRVPMTKVQLAKKAGIHRVTLAHLESGAAHPTPETVRALASALGVEPAALYGEPPSSAT